MSDRVEIRVSLESKIQNIPYKPGKDNDGENYGYKSLLRNPGLIDEIPELEGQPIMKELVSFINREGGTFETIRVIHWASCDNNIHSKVFSLGFVFRDRGLFSEYNNCLAFAGVLLHHDCSNKVENQASLLEVQPANFVQENCHGWIMDLYLKGVGKTSLESETRLDNRIQELSQLFR